MLHFIFFSFFIEIEAKQIKLTTKSDSLFNLTLMSSVIGIHCVISHDIDENAEQRKRNKNNKS